MGKSVFLALAFLCAAQTTAAATAMGAEAHRSDLKMVKGIKFPNAPGEGRPVLNTVLSTSDPSQLGGFSELVQYTLPAPDQQEAGSCLYMSLTGIAEWWVARLHPEASRAPDGPIDLSERYLMNLAGSQVNDDVEDWMTDSIYFLNKAKGTVRNVDYRFTKGWYLEDEDGEKTKARRGQKGAIYDEGYNWIDELDGIRSGAKLSLPKFRRTILFADDSENPWATGVMPAGIVEKIKEALVKNKAPVHVIYNHMGYWHANFIVGFDDNADNNNCAFVHEFLEMQRKKPLELREEAEKESDKNEQKRLLRQAKVEEEKYQTTLNAYTKGGGCHPKGVFYVRDSIYEDETAPLYDYDTKNVGEEMRYTKPIVLLEYDWINYMANHATQILVDF